MRMRWTAALLALLALPALACATGGAGSGRHRGHRPRGALRGRRAPRLRAGRCRWRGRGARCLHHDRAGRRLRTESRRTTKPGPPSGERPIIDVATVVVDAATLRPRTSERTIQRRDPSDDESYEGDLRGRRGRGATRHNATQRRGRAHPRGRTARSPLRQPVLALDLARDRPRRGVRGELRLGQSARRLAGDGAAGAGRSADDRSAGRLIRDVAACRCATAATRASPGSTSSPPHEIVQWDNGTLFLRLVETGGR